MDRDTGKKETLRQKKLIRKQVKERSKKDRNKNWFPWNLKHTDRWQTCIQTRITDRQTIKQTVKLMDRKTKWKIHTYVCEVTKKDRQTEMKTYTIRQANKKASRDIQTINDCQKWSY